MTETQDIVPNEIGSKDVLRVVLESDVKSAYDKMAGILKAENEFVKLNPSRLIGCIVKRFMTCYFEQDKTLIANEFFDSKEHLKLALKSAKTPEELEKALTEALERVKSGHGEIRPLGKKRGRKPKAQADLIDESDANLVE
jgi:hypothetical protein